MNTPEALLETTKESLAPTAEIQSPLISSAEHAGQPWIQYGTCHELSDLPTLLLSDGEIFNLTTGSVTFN